jgi:RNA polymerase sigma factor (sigma-70 family)
MMPVVRVSSEPFRARVGRERLVNDTSLDFEAFAREEFPRLVGAIGLYCGDRAVAEELAQEALLRALRRWERVGRLQRPGAWTYRVALNLATSHLRRRRLERAFEQVLSRSDRREDPPDEHLAEKLLLRQALAVLPPRQRAVVVLRYYLDLPARDTAAALGISNGSVRVLTHLSPAASSTSPAWRWRLAAARRAGGSRSRRLQEVRSPRSV